MIWARLKQRKEPNMASKGKRNVEAMVESIRESIEAGEPRLPWDKPWQTRDHSNVTSGHAYSGGNGFWAAIWAQVKGYGPQWGTFKQLVGVTGKGEAATPGVLHGIGGSLKGEQGIAMWRPVFKKETDPDTGKKVQRLVTFYPFVVFNVDQVKFRHERWTALGRLATMRGERAAFEAKLAEVKASADLTVREHTPYDEVEAALAPFEASLLGGLKHGGQSAHYDILRDAVALPDPDTFISAASYYSARLHEDTHATGAKSRLNRDGIVREDRKANGRDRYSYEELVAEFGAAYLRAEFGIEADDESKQSEAYVRTWAERISGLDDRTLYKAMGQAVKAAEWILLGDPKLRAKDDEKGASAARETEVASAT
jgi:antirestriction protein ArdC